uniref:Conotoxin Vi1361 n=1 Tax=Conus virgo TaxID=89427 RepID=CT361_CONVR|nr:RecName: Full=Conotoxin Vi1361; AltName: Full=Conotoxin Vi1360 [Conus virgo]
QCCPTMPECCRI